MICRDANNSLQVHGYLFGVFIHSSMEEYTVKIIFGLFSLLLLTAKWDLSAKSPLILDRQELQRSLQLYAIMA